MGAQDPASQQKDPVLAPAARHRICIIDYGSGNLRSVAKALERVAGDASTVIVTRSADDLAEASHIVLPGVGAFADCMAGLKALWGMREALNKQVVEGGKPFLGICVGMQMLFERGHEHGVHEGLGWLKGEVVPLVASCKLQVASEKSHNLQLTTCNLQLKIPHMGWNELQPRKSHSLIKGIRPGEHAYFVHSYHAQAAEGDIIATTDYGQSIAAVVGRDNILGTQFHPEKSQEVGLRLLKNFLGIGG